MDRLTQTKIPPSDSSFHEGMRASPTPLVGPFADDIRRLQKEAAEKNAELDAQLAAAEQLQRQSERFEHEIENHADRLFRAGLRFSAFEVRARQLRVLLIDLWGRPDERNPVDYSGLVALEAAIADYPRTQRILAANLATAQQELANFKASNLS